jgi:hypothetical protein
MLGIDLAQEHVQFSGTASSSCNPLRAAAIAPSVQRTRWVAIHASPPSAASTAWPALPSPVAAQFPPLEPHRQAKLARPDKNRITSRPGEALRRISVGGGSGPLSGVRLRTLDCRTAARGLLWAAISSRAWSSATSWMWIESVALALCHVSSSASCPRMTPLFACLASTQPTHPTTRQRAP